MRKNENYKILPSKTQWDNHKILEYKIEIVKY